MKKKFNLSGGIAFLIALLVLAVFVPINLITSYYDKVIDMTPSGKYTLNEKTAQILDDASDKHIDIYFLSEMRYVEEVPQYLPLYHTLTELESRDNITLTCFDPNKEKDLADSLDPDGVFSISDGDIFVVCDGITKKIGFRKLFQQDSNGILEYAGEELVAGAVYACTTGNLPTVYFLSGYGSKTLENDYSNFASAIKTDNYRIAELDLSQVDKVPENASILYLTAPEKDIPDSDRDKLVEYIDNGGSVSMYLPPCDTKGRFKNIEYILEKFEITMNYNSISETNAQYQLRNAENTQDENYFRVSYPNPLDESTVDLTTDINQVVSNGVANAGISHTRSFEEITSESSMIEKASVIENLPQSADSSVYTSKSTPMGGDSDTQKEAEYLSDSPLVFGYYSYNKQSGAKLFVIGTDEAISNSASDVNNPITYNLSGTRNLALFSNTWLYDSDVDMGIGNKSNSYDTMHFDSAEKAESVLRIFTVAPIVIALIGVAVWLKRRYA